jgi:hypothetical protein
MASRKPNPAHTKEYILTLRIRASPDTTRQDVIDFAHDLEWVGGCRDPDNDPFFSSVTIRSGSCRVIPKHARKVKSHA